ncbi:MAG: amidohydrolase family protein [Alphaproteobacteria bacterium]|nr:amidohydrolase family protein [Alphaproteobacteria bacterium]
MYDGPILDAFLHGPWIGGPGRTPRADVVPWTDDRRLRRVMSTFHHPDQPGGVAPRRGLAEVLADMDAAGVAAGILAAKVYYPSTPEALQSLHDELAALSGASAGRLRWIATVLPPEHGPGSYWDVMAGPRTIRALAGLPGLVGVHITPSPWGLAPNDRWYYPLYAACCDLDLALFTYVGMPGPLWPMGPNDPAHLDDVALAFPDLPIIAHHIGDPWNDMAVRLAARHANYYICTSAWSPKAYPPAVMDFMRGAWHGTRGAEKVIFASDYPLLDIARATKAARAMHLPDADLRRVLHDNARDLLFR